MDSLPLTDNEQQLLADLTKQPGWKILKDTVEASAEKRALGLSKVLLFTQEEVDPQALAYERGYYRAMFDLIRKPEQALSKTFREEKEQ